MQEIPARDLSAAARRIDGCTDGCSSITIVQEESRLIPLLFLEYRKQVSICLDDVN